MSALSEQLEPVDSVSQNLQQQIHALGPWFHNLRLGGIQTAPHHFLGDYPDVLHSSQFCWGMLPIEIPKVITAHSDVLSWSQAVRALAPPDSGWLSRYCSLVQNGLDGADAVTAPTLWMQEALLIHFSVHAPFRVIQNGRKVAEDSHPAQRRLQAMTIGRLWDEAKGISILFEIQSPMPIIIAGEKDFESSRTKQFPANMKTMGLLSQEEVLRTMRCSSVYLALSTYEPFGLAALEAAICGCAIVARDICSLREVWGEAANYFRDAAELEHLLVALRDNPHFLQQSQKASIEKATKYSASSMTAKYLELYSELMAGRKLELSANAE